eukprot:scaffold36547_cov226-Isochrysis_galbana.AAC.1
MATSALLDGWRRGERLAARVAAGSGRSHTPSPRAEAGVPGGAGGWHGCAVYIGWRAAKVAVGHVGAAGGGVA